MGTREPQQRETAPVEFTWRNFRQEPGLTSLPGKLAVALPPQVLKISGERLHKPSVPAQLCSPGGDFLPDVQPKPLQPQILAITLYVMSPGSTKKSLISLSFYF